MIRAGGTYRPQHLAILGSDGRAHVSSDTQGRGSLRITPTVGNVIRVHAILVQRPLAQGICPRHHQPFGNHHLTDVACELDTLDTLVGINGRQVGRLHTGYLAEQGQQGTRQLLKGLGFGNGIGEKGKNLIHLGLPITKWFSSYRLTGGLLNIAGFYPTE